MSDCNCPTEFLTPHEDGVCFIDGQPQDILNCDCKALAGTWAERTPAGTLLMQCPWCGELMEIEYRSGKQTVCCGVEVTIEDGVFDWKHTDDRTAP